MQASPVQIRFLGMVDYQKVFDAMKRFTQDRSATTADEIWVLQHPPVFTLGLAGEPNNLHTPIDSIPLIEVDRGGEITYHGPGQIVIYLLLDLRRKKLFVKEFVRSIEEAVIQTLRAYKVIAERKPGAPGIYLSNQSEVEESLWGAKIAALGLKITKQCSYHGLALNIDMDLSPFDAIHPCGYEGLRTVDLKSLGICENIDTVAGTLLNHLQQQLQLEPV
ncbi:MAG: lipoyl(octanoyl) transferase LipB [Burkholderiaceae bacterium]|nr:lipoyl(octanoyl) transferase LipB [Burkholderiaceae bacterium]